MMDSRAGRSGGGTYSTWSKRPGTEIDSLNGMAHCAKNGRSMNIIFEKMTLPGRRSAASTADGRFEAARTKTPFAS